MSALTDSFTHPFTESFTRRSVGEWKGMEGNGREERVETSIHAVTSVTRGHATAWMERNR